MWKSFKSWIDAAFCCSFEDDSTVTESPSPYIIPIVEQINSATGINHLESIENQNNKLSVRKPGYIDVEEKPSVEIAKETVLGELSKQKIRSVTTGISRKVTYEYINKLRLSEEVYSGDISESFITPRKVDFPSFHQVIETHQGRRYDWSVINYWSRHMAEALDVKGQVPLLVRASVDLNKIGIPIDTENKRLQKFRENRARTSATGNQMSACIDTRDQSVRPKAAFNQRTKHCFTHNKTEDIKRIAKHKQRTWESRSKTLRWN